MTNFAARERYARQLMDEQGLADWRFEWDSARTRGGICRHHIKKISVSRIVAGLNDDAWFIETLLHEIAHAIVGPGNGHNTVWRTTLIRLGGSGKRTHDGAVKREAHKYVAACAKCGIIGSCARMSKRSTHKVCVKHRLPVQWYRLNDGERLDNHLSVSVVRRREVVQYGRKFSK